MAIRVFFCYAQKDKKLLNKLYAHLKSFIKSGIIEIWCDQDISAGTEWEPDIIKHLNQAHIVLLLISADFIDSDNCYGKEMERALERHNAGEARVIPVLLRPIYSVYEPFRKLQALPTNGKPVIKWPVKDDAFVDIAEGLADVIRELDIQQEAKKTQQVITLPSNISTTSKKKALLVIAGGQLSADILILRYLQPELVVVITSQKGSQFQRAFVDELIQILPTCKVLIVPGINAYDIDATMKAGRETCFPYPDTEWDWTFTLNSGTKTMTLAAYELAKQKNIPCWYIDIMHEKVISLVKDIQVDTRRLFHLTVEKYLKSYGYRVADELLADYRELLLAWTGIARELVLTFDPDKEFILNMLLKHKNVGEPITLPLRLTPNPLLQFLEKNRFLEITENRNDSTLICFTSNNCARFINSGIWLELYIWHEIISAGFVDDCRWSIQITKDEVYTSIDLAFTYKARLLIAEWCTSRHPFEVRYLDRLDSAANMLGGNYVRKIFITNQPRTTDNSNNRPYTLFCQRAHLKNIRVVTKEELADIVYIIREEMLLSTV